MIQQSFENGGLKILYIDTIPISCYY